MDQPSSDGVRKAPAAYVMPSFWQCTKCLFVTHDPTWTRLNERRCEHCNAPADKVYAWPGRAGEVYHAVLHDFEDRNDWVASSVRAITLCSLAEVHEARLVWSIAARRGCPRAVALSIVKAIRRQDLLRLFHELVGKRAKHFKLSGGYRQFWSDIEKLRGFRNDFIHGEPEKPDTDPADIPGRLASVIVSVEERIEQAFQELTNNSLSCVTAQA